MGYILSTEKPQERPPVGIYPEETAGQGRLWPSLQRREDLRRPGGGSERSSQRHSLSPSARDLIARCLTVDHRKRISLDSLLCHSFFNQHQLKLSASSSSIMLTSPTTSTSTESSSPMITDSPMTSGHSLIVMTV